MKRLLSKLYVAWVLFVFSFFMILYLPGIILPFLFGERYGTISYQFLKLWSWTFSKLNFIRYVITGQNNIKRHHSYIYVSNHTSYLDIPGMCLTVPTQIRPLAKKELKKVPVFGWIVSRAAIIVDRSSNESRRKSMDHLKDVLKKGISILIFPEGTQNRSKDLLAPFYDGAFRIAVETQQPIMPMVIHNAGKLMPPTEFVIRPGTIHIEVLPEIPTTGLTTQDVPALKEKVMALMISKLQST
ncbi:MAG: lysophospholipid acyltransferase family protein [Cyclobacteriaceae bacterium]|nr:1-acyl-sn-glycerol-3-phosphate acyltransferase [Cytophagales bacterium]HNP77511.1 lysophospholipid acyltransferase family protein [Cyclobacteriaceae bacterium]